MSFHITQRPRIIAIVSLLSVALTAFLVSCVHDSAWTPFRQHAGDGYLHDGGLTVNLNDDGQTREQSLERSAGCVSCHQGVTEPHSTVAKNISCVDCHGGDGGARTKEAAHPAPHHPEAWPTSANPERTYELINDEDWDWVRFVNPGDLRVANVTCGPCHADYVLKVKKSVMTTASHFWGTAGYANGLVSAKRTIFGQSFSEDGIPQKVNQLVRDEGTGNWREPTDDEIERYGWTRFIVPLPHWEITQPGNVYRVFEQGSRLGGPPLGLFGLPIPLVGLPDKFEDQGRPNNRLSDRGLGTSNRVDLPMLNVHKTRLNDPHLSMLGTNDQPGDYRSSGCTACHMIYANDRSPTHSGPYAVHGNMGLAAMNPDPTIPKDEPGHPIDHKFTTAIPSSQCMVCHMHQPNSFVNSYYGFTMWNYESDAEGMWPKAQAYPDHHTLVSRLDRNPEAAATRGLWGDVRFLKDTAITQNPGMQHTQFADYHGHGWMFRGVFKMDRKGNLLDKDDKVVPYDNPDKFKGVYPIAGQDDPHFDPHSPQAAQRAVHMKDIHAEVGMHCVDCHFTNDAHGDGNLHAEYQAAVEIGCQDCHGTVYEYAPLKTSGPAAQAHGSLELTTLRTPFGKRQFEIVDEGGKEVVIQRSMLEAGKEWRVSQVRDSVTRGNPEFNERAAYSKTIQRDNATWGKIPARPDDLAHRDTQMECYACHTSWVTACFGCHLPQDANVKTKQHHFEDKYLRNYASYNPQVVRDAEFLLGVAGDVKGNKIAPVRSSSAVMISSTDSQRRIIYGQLPTMGANGMSSQLFNTHFPHTVRKTETRKCDDCHVSATEDNNAWLAQTYLLGTGVVGFMGRNAYVGAGEDGFYAVRVSEWDEPQAVIGSNLHRMAFPDWYQAHLDSNRVLQESEHHTSTDARNLVLRGEYLYVASGEGGMRVYDVANVDNKDFAQKIVTAPVSPLGQDTHVATRFATAVALPFNNPTSMGRTVRPENREQTYFYKGREQNLHEVYRYAYVTDLHEGLVVVDVDCLTDGDPQNNFIKRFPGFNPNGLLNGAVNLALAGNIAYICCDAGIVAIDIHDPLAPRVVSQTGSSSIVKPKAIEVQFRYAFVVDDEGLKVLDITDPAQMAVVPGADVPLDGARHVYVGKTYAYVSAGPQGLYIIDVERPRNPKTYMVWNADGRINDLHQVRIAMTNDTVFAYLADGKNGLRVAQMVAPEDGGRSAYGFSPPPRPKLVSRFRTGDPAIAVARAMDRDRAVDESGNQTTLFGRIGGRPMNREEMQKLYLRNGQVYRVSNAPR